VEIYLLTHKENFYTLKGTIFGYTLIGDLFKIGDEESSSLYWGKNRWLVTTVRDSLCHDFFHYFLHKTYCRKHDLSERETKTTQPVERGDFLD